ncbi:hypothetical protein RUM44_013712 [Polyplax serrata]|uniref:Uncharacterized protein n=1 Tax=Polyplax serrata TaxID=468196 RepID=A0ABR1BGT9_POLSC
MTLKCRLPMKRAEKMNEDDNCVYLKGKKHLQVPFRANDSLQEIISIRAHVRHNFNYKGLLLVFQKSHGASFD